jgi:hypothetical protein
MEYDESALTVAAIEHPRFELLGAKRGSVLARSVTDSVPDNDSPGDSSYNEWKTGWIDDGGPAFENLLPGPFVSYTQTSVTDTTSTWTADELAGSTIYSVRSKPSFNFDRSVVESNTDTTVVLRYPWDPATPKVGNPYSIFVNDEDGSGVLMRMQINSDTLTPGAHRLALVVGYHLTRIGTDPIYDAKTLNDGWIAAGVSCLDADGDVVPDAGDNCPNVQNYDQADAEPDGIGDFCDDDDDNDAVLDEHDRCSDTKAEQPVDGAGCSQLQVDEDADSVCNPATTSSLCGGSDACGGTPSGAPVDVVGCADIQVDSDQDTICNPSPPSLGPSVCSGSDNCPAIANLDQDNFDGDLAGDVCDADDDDDLAPDTNEDWNGDGLVGRAETDPFDPDTDNDTRRDGADNCPLTANPTQADADAEGFGPLRKQVLNRFGGDVCDIDDDNDGHFDDDEVACGSDPLDPQAIPERLDASFAGADDDADTQIDEPLPPGAGASDCDGDGYSGTTETHVFGAQGRDQDACGIDGWPSDLDGNGRIGSPDLQTYLTPTRRLGASLGDPAHDARWDLRPGVGFSGDINIQDMASMLTGSPADPRSAYPPMLGSTYLGEKRALGGSPCPSP